MTREEAIAAISEIVDNIDPDDVNSAAAQVDVLAYVVTGSVIEEKRSGVLRLALIVAAFPRENDTETLISEFERNTRIYIRDMLAARTPK